MWHRILGILPSSSSSWSTLGGALQMRPTSPWWQQLVHGERVPRIHLCAKILASEEGECICPGSTLISLLGVEQSPHWGYDVIVIAGCLAVYILACGLTVRALLLKADQQPGRGGDTTLDKVSSTFTMVTSIFGPSSSSISITNRWRSTLSRLGLTSVLVLALAPAYFTAPLLVLSAALLLLLAEHSLSVLLQLWLTLRWADLVQALIIVAWTAYAVVLSIPFCFAFIFAYWASQDIKHLYKSNKR